MSPKNKRLHDLARNPLLLTLLCIAFEELLDFPSQRSEIYKEALEAMLKKWDTSRKIKRDQIDRRLSIGRMQKMLTQIAAETFQEGIYLFELHWIAQKVVDYLQTLPPLDSDYGIDGESIVKEIVAQYGIFVERAKDLYSFSHLTFQEYYTAMYIVEHIYEGALESLIHNYFMEDKWREVFLLAAEMLENAEIFFEIFLSVLEEFASKHERIVTLLKHIDQMRESDIPVRNLLKRLKDMPLNSYAFTEEQIQHFNKYLDSIMLFLDCLDVARVPNRVAIEGKLLRSPEL